MSKKEKRLGAKFSYKKSTYRLVEREDKECTECAFYDMCDDDLIEKTIGACVASERSDNINVIVELVKEDKQ